VGQQNTRVTLLSNNPLEPAQWHTPVIPATWETEARGAQVQGQPGPHRETLSCLKIMRQSCDDTTPYGRVTHRRLVLTLRPLAMVRRPGLHFCEGHKGSVEGPGRRAVMLLWGLSSLPGSPCLPTRDTGSQSAWWLSPLNPLNSLPNYTLATWLSAFESVWHLRG
jgi:hypothetical protein